MSEQILKLMAEMIPLYIFAVIGFITGKCFKLDNKSIATLTIFVIAPIVFCLSIAKLRFTPEVLIAPLLFYCIAVILSFITLHVTRLYLGDKTPYLAAHVAGTSNWGYFGVPIAFMLFPPEVVAIYMITGVVYQIYENSFGIYFISRGHSSPAESLKNILRYPVLYAVIVGAILSVFSIDLPPFVDKILELDKGAYTVMGMMLIGLGLSTLEKLTFDWKFLVTCFALKFVIWPLIITGVILLDQQLNILGEIFYKPLLLLSIVPMGANNIAFATKFDMNPGKASIAVVLTTLFAILYVPLMINLLGIQ